jgi:hypothetical protein
MKFICCLTGFLLAIAVSVAAPRTWVLKKGDKIEGEYVSSGTTTVVVKKMAQICF